MFWSEESRHRACKEISDMKVVIYTKWKSVIIHSPACFKSVWPPNEIYPKGVSKLTKTSK